MKVYSQYEDRYVSGLEEGLKALRDQLAKANVRVRELELVVIAITHADETGYVDGEGFVQGWNEVCDETKSLLNKFAIEKKIEAIDDAIDYYEELKSRGESINAGTLLHVCLVRLVSQEEQLRKEQPQCK